MSMKDLLSKMTELQGTVESVEVAPVTATGKKVLNESSNTMKESTKPSLKSIFSSLLSEAEQVTIQPAKQNTQVIKQGQKTLGTVENPQLAQQIKQSIGKGEMTLAGDELQEDDMAEGSEDYQEIFQMNTKQGKVGAVVQYNDKSFGFIYGTQLDPRKFDRARDADQALNAHHNKQGMTESKLTEKAVSKSQQQAAGAALAAKRGDTSKSKLTGASKEMAKMPAKELEKFAKTKHKGLPEKKKTNEGRLDKSKYFDNSVKPKAGDRVITVSSSGTWGAFDFRIGDEFEVVKVHRDKDNKEWLEVKVYTPENPMWHGTKLRKWIESTKVRVIKPTNEAAMPTHDGDFGAGLGAGRNSKTLESKKSKPDYIDLDKDGNKKESMKKAATDATKKVAVKEGRLPKVKVEKRLGKYAVIDDGEVVKTFIAKYEADEHANYLNDKKAAADKQKVSTMKKTNETSTINGKVQDPKSLRWKQTSMSYDEALKKYGKNNVKKGAKDGRGQDTILVHVPLGESKARPDFPDIDGDGDKKESMKKAAADKKTGSADKKSSAGLTAAQKKLPAGLQKAAADAKKKKVAIKENITAKYGYGPQMHDQIINATPSQLRRMAYNMADGPGYQRISHEIDQLMKAQAELRQEAGLPLVVDEPEEAPIPSKPSLGQRFKSFVGLKEGSDSETVNEISTDLKQRARDKATDLANIAGDKNHHMAQKVRTDQADKFQAGMEKDFKKNRRNAERDSLSPAQRRKLGMMEGANPSEAARLLGKAHAMGKDPFACKYEAGTHEAQAYLDGYKEGLDECYGSGGMGMAQDMSQDIGMMPGMDSMVSQDSMMDSPSPRGGSEFAFGGFDEVSDDDMMAFESWDRELNALLNEAVTPKFQVRYLPNNRDTYKIEKGFASKKEAQDWIKGENLRDRAEDISIETSTNKEVNEGKMKDIDIDMKQMSDAEFKKEHGKSKADMKKDLSSDTKKPVKEGISVSVSKGQQGAPDSVSVTAQDGDADALLAMIKQAGLGLFGGDEPSGYGSPASAATQPVGDIGDHDSMMALIKKMSSTGNDYEDEESMSCDSCDDESDSKALVVGEEQGYDDKEDESLGMRTGKESDKDQSMKDRRDDSYGKFGKRTDEDETEDQMEFEVAESNAPDSGEAETTADENAEAKEDQALAGAMSGNEEEIDEGSCSMDEEEELTEWANDAGYEGSENIKDNTFEQDIEFMTRVISGGLNGPKKDQTTLPHTKVKVEESRQAINEWKKLSGIK